MIQINPPLKLHLPDGKDGGDTGCLPQGHCGEVLQDVLPQDPDHCSGYSAQIFFMNLCKIFMYVFLSEENHFFISKTTWKLFMGFGTV
jgi:hypothetical protein